MDTRVMASMMTIWCYRLTGITFVIIGISKAVIGAWGFAIGWLLLSTVWFYLAYRVSHHPVFLIKAQNIDILTRPAFPPIEVQITDIKNVIVTRFTAKIILQNGKTVKLPLSLLRKTDRDMVARRLTSLTMSMNTGEG
jgi:hypothetical protein